VQRTFRPSGSREVPSGHGTAIAALLVGQASGDLQALVPQARLFAADVFYLQGDEVRSDALAILRALDWAVESDAEVIALSLSGEANGALQRGIRAAARRAGLVAAAGNGGPNGAPAYPAAYPEVLAVTAIDVRKRPYRNANRGSYVDLAAPGVGIWSADADGGFTNWSGTSFAVPFVAAALLHAGALSGGDSVRARALLAESAEDLGAIGRDEVYGWGLLRAPRSACR
jgi:subtilisin family serine protease